MIRQEVRAFVDLGPLPPSDASEEEIARHEQALVEITMPVSQDEASLLIASFGPDDCFGLAWTLLHLVESAPTPPLTRDPGPESNEWLCRLWLRQRGTGGTG
jgi:hypothetical protein